MGVVLDSAVATVKGGRSDVSVKLGRRVDWHWEPWCRRATIEGDKDMTIATHAGLPHHHQLTFELPRGGFGPRARLLVLGASLFMGIGALGGAYELLHDAEAFGMKAAWLNGSPFSNYTLPALFLGIVIGGGMLGVATLTWMRHETAPLAAVVLGETLIVWLTIETAVIGYRGAQQMSLLVICGACGLALIVAGYEALWGAKSRRA